MKNRDFFLLVLVAAIWGVNFSLIKLGLDRIDPYLLAALRFTLCAIPAVFFVKRPQVAWKYIIAYGLVFGALQWGFIYAALQMGVSAGMASMLTQTSVFMSMLLGVLLYRETVNAPLMLGSLLSFSGVFLIFYFAESRSTIFGMILMLAGALAWSVSNVIAKAAQSDEPFAFFIWASLVAPLPLFGMMSLHSGAQAIPQLIAVFDGKLAFSLFFQVVPTSLFGYSMWNRMIKKYPVSQVAPMSLLVPVFGLLASVLIFAETLPLHKRMAMFLIFAGLLVQRFGQQFMIYCRLRWSTV
ncbi:MAG: hypothetical protein E6Q34_03565 [Burkholderiaceae bacterium]|nr:MAG: hypothetical protein E6Q34_03565 [Burkholderiaceae bacterium]